MNIWVPLIILAGLTVASCSSSNRWDEDVQLSNGQVIAVERKTRILRVPLADGNGSVQEQWFRYKPLGIEWHTKNLLEMPLSFDIIDGIPYLVTSTGDICQEPDGGVRGIHVIRWEGRRPTEVQGAPALLARFTYNLHREYQGLNRFDDTHVRQTLAAKRDGWRGPGRFGGDPWQGRPLVQWETILLRKIDSCEPAREPIPDAARERSVDAVRRATDVQAELREFTSEPESVTRKSYFEQRGAWAETAWVTPSCTGIVKAVETVTQWSENKANFTLVGYRLVLSQTLEQKLPLYVDAHASIQSVACDETSIYVVLRRGKERLFVHRFRRDADSLDVFQVLLPDTARIEPGSTWSPLWTVRPIGEESLAIELADYSYESIAENGGTINRKATYVVRLPLVTASMP